MERYRLRQPQTLEDLAVDKLAAWIGIQANNFKSTLSNLHKGDAAKAEAVLSQQIEIIRDRLECHLPMILFDKLLAKTIPELYRLSIQTRNRLPEADDDFETAIITNGRMVETLFSKYVKSLSLTFNQFKTLVKPICSKSHLLTGLVSLDLTSYKSYYIFHYTAQFQDGIIQMVKELHNLKYLNLLILDTDRIVRCIVKNCPLIEKLALHTTTPMRDDTIKLLPQLIHLRSITLGTKLKISGYEEILLNCKKIEYINCLKPSEHVKVSEAVNRVAFSKNVGTLNLKSHRICHPSKQNLEKIFQICPLIQNLIIYQTLTSKNNSADDITPINELKYLREMTLYATHNVYTPYQLLLKVVGHKIEDLCYVGGNEMDLDAAIELSKMCPYLISLHLMLHKHMAMPSSGSKRKFEVSPFMQLRKLTVTVDIPLLNGHEVEFDNAPVFFLLSNCPNVEFIEVYMPSWFTEDEMLKILDLNPMRHLKKIKILYSRGRLTPLVIERLTKNGNNPEVIEIGA